MSGVYLRDSRGSTYYRLRPISNSAIITNSLDIAVLYERPINTTYVINYTSKTVKAKKERTEPIRLGPSPPPRQAFQNYHYLDQFLGTQVVAGVECEGYKIRGPGKKARYDNEVWYAPSLNFLAVAARHARSKHEEFVMLVTDIQLGREAPAAYFQVPKEFKIIK